MNRGRAMPRGTGRGRVRTRSPSGSRGGARSPERSMTTGATSTSSSSSQVGDSREIEETVKAVETMSVGGADVQGPTTYPRGALRGLAHGHPSELGDAELVTRPEGFVKKGSKGAKLNIMANYYKLNAVPAWSLHHYDVKFEPEEDRRTFKKRLMRSVMDRYETGYMFDGAQLFVSKQIECAAGNTVTVEDRDGKKINITLTYVGMVKTGSPVYVQLYNLLIRKCLFALELQEMGRNFFDPKAKIAVPAHKLELWPGYVTSMRSHEQDILLCVEVTHKVLRTDTVLDVIRSIERNRPGDRNAVISEFKDTIVMTSFNQKTYHVDDVDYSLNPMSTFDLKGETITFVDYYKKKYDIEIQDKKQPLLISRPSKKDLHRGFAGPALLIPELCQSTGLTDAMRSNFTLMKDLSKHLHQGPGERVKVIEEFMRRLRNNEQIKKEFERWGLHFDEQMVKLDGRLLSNEKMIFAQGEQPVDDKGDFTLAFRSQKLLTSVHLTDWAVLVPQRDAGGVENLVRTMSKVSGNMGMQIKNPKQTVSLPDIRVPSYLRAIDEVLRNHPNLQMLFVILPNNKLETYAAVKKALAVQRGILSQCFVAKNVQSKGLMSIATKVAVQMNAKLGGEPWTIKLPMKDTMFVGFDVYHGAKGTKGGSIGAMVATFSPKFTKYFSTTSTYKDTEELSRNVHVDFEKCLKAYRDENGNLPERIIMYRDGVGDGQITMVHAIELQALKKGLKEFYGKANQPEPKLTFIIVTKKINTRLFQVMPNRNFANPGPGSIVDDVVTLPERYDFFLISCAARQGTVSPCSYNVIHDESGYDPDRIQLITYKMCHMYFNWSGTIAVPAPCQYAHKLAFLTGMAYAGHANEKLSRLLHFL